MGFTLYNAPQSTCSQRVRFVLNAKGLPFAEIKLNLLEGDQLKPDYLKLNPNGVVPTLDHDGAIVTDSTVITEYLDEVVPPGELLARAKAEAARLGALPNQAYRATKTRLRKATVDHIRSSLAADMATIMKPA